MDFRAIFTILGALIASLGLSMLIPAMADAMVGHEDWRIFLGSSVLTTLFGAGLWASSMGSVEALTLRQAFLLTTLIWVVLAFFGSLPFFWSKIGLSFTDSFFESVSGITTTGSTILNNLDTTAPGILLWRGMMQWFGGLGVVVMAIAVLPTLQVGGMQMFKAESFETPDKILPKAGQIASGMSIIYLLLTLICGVAYWFFGMSAFDATIHAMTTLATGGFSTSDAGFQKFHSQAIDYTAIVFMLLAAIPFALYLGAIRQGRWRHLLQDSQATTFLKVVAFATFIVTWMLIANGAFSGEEAVRLSLFAVVNTITGSGFTSIDYGAWGAFAVAIFFTLTFIGGCTGSTSCGIKIFRFQILARDLYQHVHLILMPSRLYLKKYNGQPLPENVSTSVQSFVFLYFVFFFILASLLSASGMDFISAISGAATAISNVGPGLGDVIGPSGNFSSLNDVSKWLLIIGMLVGRLEILIVLVLFIPRFWRA